MDKKTKNLIAKYVAKHHIPLDKDNNPVPLGVLYYINQLIQDTIHDFTNKYIKLPKNKRPIDINDPLLSNISTLSAETQVQMLFSILQNRIINTGKQVSAETLIDIFHRSIETYMATISYTPITTDEDVSVTTGENIPFGTKTPLSNDLSLLIDIHGKNHAATMARIPPPANMALNLTPYFNNKFPYTGAYNKNRDQEVPAHISNATSILYNGEDGMLVMVHTFPAARFWGISKWCVSEPADASNMNYYFAPHNKSSPLLFYAPNINQQNNPNSQKTYAIHNGLYFDHNDSLSNMNEIRVHFNNILQKMKAGGQEYAGSLETSYLTQFQKTTYRPDNHLELLKKELLKEAYPQSDTDQSDQASLMQKINRWKFVILAHNTTDTSEILEDVLNDIDFMIFSAEHRDYTGYFNNTPPPDISHNPEFILDYAKKDPRAFMLADDDLFYDPAFGKAALGYLLERYDRDDAAQREYNIAANSIYHRLPHFFGQIEKSMDIDFVKAAYDALSRMTPQGPLPSTSYFSP